MTTALPPTFDPFAQRYALPLDQPSISQRTTPTSLNLDEELIQQLDTAKRLLKEAEYAPVPLNQKAQTINSIAAIIGQLIKQQESLRNIATLTKIENALISTLRKFPDVQDEFLRTYGDKLC
jgi:hypothetical protein